MISCAGTGQDGESRIGLTRNYTDNGDGTITDNRTGLMWEKLTDDGSIHDKDTTYYWTDGFNVKIATLNSSSFAGHADWRVPSINELQSLIDYGAVSPAVPPPFNTNCVSNCNLQTCSCSSGSYVWSSTSKTGNPGAAWDLYDSWGFSNSDAKGIGLGLGVRAVRGGS